MKATIRTGNVEAFFKRGRDTSRLADTGTPIPAEWGFAYEVPEVLARVVIQRLKAGPN